MGKFWDTAHKFCILSQLSEFNLEDQKKATYEMFGAGTDYDIADEGKQQLNIPNCIICFETRM